MSELLSEIIIDLRENSDILNSIRTSKILIKDLIGNLKYDKIFIITDKNEKLIIEDKRVIIVKKENIDNLLNNKIIKIEDNNKIVKILSIVLFIVIILFLINIDNILILIFLLIIILIRDNLRKVINIFYKKKIVI
jgi:hypothetical protein